MEMEQQRAGGRKVVTFDETMIGRRRNGFLSTTYHDIGRAAGPLQPQGAVSRRRTYADGELDVFAAERYFKGAMDAVHHRKEDGAAVVVPPAPSESTMAAVASASPAAAVAKPAGTRASAASVSASSATSANSQTVLLSRRRGHRDKKCCVQVGVLMRSCSGKRSVRVDGGGAAKEKDVPGAGEQAASKIDWYRELRMQKAALGVAGDGGNHGVVAAAAGLPPNLSLGTAKVAAVGREVIREEEAAEFTFSSSRRAGFTLVAPVRANAPPSGRVGGGGEHEGDDDDGAGSESSSDLFEIKSLMIDDCPYEPSEASIQWSVATASAADASSERISARWIGGGGRGGGRGQVRQHRDRPAGLLSGCVSHRAVDVSAAPNAPAAVAARRRGERFPKAQNNRA